MLTSEDKRCCMFAAANGKNICVRNLKSFHAYQKQIMKKTPTAEQKWEAEGFNITCWKKICELPYQVRASTKLQSLWFRVLHHYIPTRKFLYNKNVIGTLPCRRCFQPDTLQHFLFGCEDVRPLWDEILHKLKEIYSLPHDFSRVYTILFWFPSAPAAVNLIILRCKQYILYCKGNKISTVPNHEQCLRSIFM